MIAGIQYNDVWVYDTDCVRYADLPCADEGWRLLHPGKTFGGCNNQNGKLVCETPSERYGHGSAMLNETTMAVYGGYSNECEDYCDDMWLFDFLSLKWTKVEPGPTTPGNRWQFSMVSDGSSSIYLFGGHRLWHGFSSDNEASNRWQNTDEIPKGGYLNDLWMYGNIDDSARSSQKSMRPDDYHSSLLSRTSDTNNNAAEKQWIEIKGKTTCVDAPGLTWESRHDQYCEIIWPSARSGQSSVYDEKRGGMWIHGGFSAYYPYPTSKDSGSSLGTRSLGREHVALFPTWEFYLEDLWFYNFKSGVRRRFLVESLNDELVTYFPFQETCSFYMEDSETIFILKILGTTSLMRIDGWKRPNSFMHHTLTHAQMTLKLFRTTQLVFSWNFRQT